MLLAYCIPRQSKTGNKIFLFLFLFLSPFYLHAQTADEIIKKYTNFIGGEKQWKNVKTIITSGEYNYGGVAFPFKAYSKVPDQYKFVVTFNGKYYAQAFDGKTGWKIDAFNGDSTSSLLAGKAALAMANEANVELEDALINYKDKGHQASLEGKDTVRGKSCFKVKFIRKNGEAETYYFEEKTAELVMKKAVAKNPEMGGDELTIFYSDYHNSGNIKIPFKSIAKTKDQTILAITISNVEINTAIEDAEFQPPGKR